MKRISNEYTPKPEQKFTFGLWTVGNPGGDAFGEPVRAKLSPADIVYLLGEVGAYGVNFHDNDLIPIDATPAEAEAIIKAFKKALFDTGVVVPMATTNLFANPAFKAYEFDRVALGQRGMKYEKLDQWVNELLLGVR